jgi:hypothetical protein
MSVGGVGSAPASAALEMLGAAPAATPTTDPANVPFAGLLARVMSASKQANATSEADPLNMVESAISSLESALADASAATTAGSATGNDAIRALVAQVTQGATTPVAPAIDAAAQMLSGASGVTPAVTPTMVESTDTQSKAQALTTGDDDKRADSDKDNATPTETGTGEATVRTAPTLNADPAVAVRDMASLDPAFRAKLDTVIDRMKKEYGYDVTVTETVRSQTRQDALYEQGRSRPGQVVTWTRNSRHGEGLAADVKINGGYDNPLAFERLQRIANEEGLHTLGARDPGHLELRSPTASGFTAKIATALPSNTVLNPSPDKSAKIDAAAKSAFSRIAGVAHVAEVAVTAGVARVASVARVVTPGTVSPRVVATTTTAAAATSDSGAKGAASATPVSNAPTAKGATSTNEVPTIAVKGAETTASANREKSADSDSRTPRKSDAADVTADTTAPATPASATPRDAGRTGAIDAIGGPDQASRVAHIDALHEQVASQPVSSMTLNVEDGNGGTNRVRVDVRGTSVSSTIDVKDQQAAADLSARSSDLARALESRGLEADTVRVRAVGGERPMTETMRNAVGGDAASPRTLQGALAADASGSSRRDRDDARDPRQGSQQSQDSNRQRSRREREEQPQ